MRRGRYAARVAAAVVAANCLAGCGSPAGPGPLPPPPPPPPPANAVPVIESITIQGMRPKQPANFADLGDIIEVRAKVTDAETAPEQLEYQWTASAGGFDGAGLFVQWRAPAEAQTPKEVTISVKVIERYGHPGAAPAFSHEVTGEAKLSLHNSAGEVGAMSRQFLLDFSDTNIRDADYIMRNFGSKCPEPSEVASERIDVVNNFTNFRITDFRVGEPQTTVNFDGRCPIVLTRGDACTVVPVMWESTRLADGARGVTEGFDILSASFSIQEDRWWLCSSRYLPQRSFGAVRFIR